MSTLSKKVYELTSLCKNLKFILIFYQNANSSRACIDRCTISSGLRQRVINEAIDYVTWMAASANLCEKWWTKVQTVALIYECYLIDI